MSGYSILHYSSCYSYSRFYLNLRTLYIGLLIGVWFVFIFMKRTGQFDIRNNFKSKLIVGVGLVLLIPLVVQGYDSINRYMAYEENIQDSSTLPSPGEPMTAKEAARYAEQAQQAQRNYHQPNIPILLFGCILFTAYINWVLNTA